MDEQKQTPKPEEEPKQEKKLSRTTLTFYIIGMFSIAIALILISYVAQSRADKQLDTLADQLSEQQTAAQGFAQKMEDLQKQLTEKTDELDALRSQLGLDEQTPLSEGVQKLRDREQVLELLVAAEEAARAGDTEKLAGLLDGFTDAWSEDELKPAAQGGLFDEQDYAAYQSLLQLAGENKE